MGRTVILPDDVYTRLEQQAADRGIEIPQLIARLERELEQARLAASIERMRAEGVLLPPRGPTPTEPRTFTPIEIKGKPLSETIIEERR